MAGYRQPSDKSDRGSVAEARTSGWIRKGKRGGHTQTRAQAVAAERNRASKDGIVIRETRRSTGRSMKGDAKRIDEK